MEKQYLNVGQQLYYCFNPGMVIPVRVVELQDIYIAPKNIQEKYNLSGALWHTYGEECEPYVFRNVKVENKVGVGKYFSLNILDECEKVNQFIWIDEPLGHEVELDDNVFFTIKEAFRSGKRLFGNGGKSYKRQRNRANKKLNEWRNYINRYVYRTHGEEAPEVEWENKKIYIKRR